MLRYPIDFDDNIREQTEKCSNNEERKRIREFASMTAIGFKHQVRQKFSFFPRTRKLTIRSY